MTTVTITRAGVLRITHTPERTTVEALAYVRAEVEHDPRQLELPLLARPAAKPPVRIAPVIDIARAA